MGLRARPRGLNGDQMVMATPRQIEQLLQEKMKALLPTHHSSPIALTTHHSYDSDTGAGRWGSVCDRPVPRP